MTQERKIEKQDLIQAIWSMMLLLGVTYEELGTGLADEETSKSEMEREKNYTILEFRDTENKSNILELKENGCYSQPEYPTANSNITEHQMLNVGFCVESRDFEIYKVRRNSDGVEFTLGDSIKVETFDKTTNVEVEEFVIDSNWSGGMVIKFSKDWSYAINNVPEPIPAPKEKKKSILTTVDGVEIYDEYQLLFGVSELWSKVHQNYEGSVLYPLTEMKNGKWFSTSKARDKYIEENEPRYTLKDIRAAWKDGADGHLGAIGWKEYKQNKLGIK